LTFDPYKENIPNTFAPNCENKKFSISMIGFGLRRGFIDRNKIPPDIAKLAWDELDTQIDREQKKRKELEKELEVFKQKTKTDSEIRYLADQYLLSRFGGPRFHGTSYWMIERACSLNTHQLKIFLHELIRLIKDELVDKRNEKNRQRYEKWDKPKFRLVDEFLDSIPLEYQDDIVEQICKLDDSKNDRLAFLSGINGCIYGYFEYRPELKDIRTNKRDIT